MHLPDEIMCGILTLYSLVVGGLDAHAPNPIEQSPRLRDQRFIPHPARLPALPPQSAGKAVREQDAMMARRRCLQVNVTLVTLVIIALMGILPSSTLARTRDEVQLGDPDIGDQGPAKGSGQTIKQVPSDLEQIRYTNSQRWRTWLTVLAAISRPYR